MHAGVADAKNVPGDNQGESRAHRGTQLTFGCKIVKSVVKDRTS